MRILKPFQRITFRFAVADAECLPLALVCENRKAANIACRLPSDIEAFQHCMQNSTSEFVDVFRAIISYVPYRVPPYSRIDNLRKFDEDTHIKFSVHHTYLNLRDVNSPSARTYMRHLLRNFTDCFNTHVHLRHGITRGMKMFIQNFEKDGKCPYIDGDLDKIFRTASRHSRNGFMRKLFAVLPSTLREQLIELIQMFNIVCR